MALTKLRQIHGFHASPQEGLLQGDRTNMISFIGIIIIFELTEPMSKAEQNATKVMEKVFREFDDNSNGRFSRMEFPKVVKVITDLIGADVAT